VPTSEPESVPLHRFVNELVSHHPDRDEVEKIYHQELVTLSASIRSSGLSFAQAAAAFERLAYGATHRPRVKEAPDLGQDAWVTVDDGILE
jgi:hypothetical protein